MNTWANTHKRTHTPPPLVVDEVVVVAVVAVVVVASIGGIISISCMLHHIAGLNVVVAPFRTAKSILMPHYPPFPRRPRQKPPKGLCPA